MFPPGWGSPATNPSPTGSVTMGSFAFPSASFNAPVTWRHEGTAARNDSETARGESNA